MKSKVIKAYKTDMDGFYSNIVIVEVDKSFIDNIEYFKTFNAAKKAMLSRLKDMIDQYKANYKEMKALKSFK